MQEILENNFFFLHETIYPNKQYTDISKYKLKSMSPFSSFQESFTKTFFFTTA